MKKNIVSKGFTLIEILVVIAIIVILTAIILASSTGARSAARDGQRIADLKNIQLKLEQYYTNEREYPDSLDDLKPKYAVDIPKDPIATQSYEYDKNPTDTPKCPNGKDGEYRLIATLENDRAGVVDKKYVVCDPYSNPL